MVDQVNLPILKPCLNASDQSVHMVTVQSNLKLYHITHIKQSWSRKSRQCRSLFQLPPTITMGQEWSYPDTYLRQDGSYDPQVPRGRTFPLHNA